MGASATNALTNRPGAEGISIAEPPMARWSGCGCGVGESVVVKNDGADTRSRSPPMRAVGTELRVQRLCHQADLLYDGGKR